METVRLEDICLRDHVGEYGIAAAGVDYTSQTHRYLRITDISDDGRLLDADIKGVQGDIKDKYFLKTGDIVFARTGNSTGRAYTYDERDGELVYAGFLIRYRLDPAKVNPKYLHYFTHSNYYKTWVDNLSSGSTRGNISAQTFADCPILLPSRERQDQLVSVLSALDRKIALNRRKIATLEKMAKEIYDYWFVQYDFPDANGRPYKSSGGEMVYSPELKREIPKGWKVEQLKDVLKVCNGKDHKSLKDGTIPVYGSGGVMRCVDTAMYSQPSVLIPRKGTLNNIIYARKPFWCVDTIFYTTSTVSNFTKYLYYSIRDMDFMSLNTGTAVPSMTAGVIGLIAIPMPTLGLLESFDKTLEHLFLSRDSAQNEVERLTALRDFLLPLLMNGQVRIGGVA